MNIRTRLSKLEHPVRGPCFKLAERLRKARETPRTPPCAETVEKLVAAGDRFSLKLARALAKYIKE